MTKRTKRFSVLALAFAMVFTMAFSSTAFAADNNSAGDTGLSQQSVSVTRSTSYQINGNWTTVYTKPALTCVSLKIRMLNLSLHRNDVRMLNSSGQVVWSGNGAISNNGQKTFTCDTGVVKVQVRLNGGGSIYGATAYIN